MHLIDKYKNAPYFTINRPYLPFDGNIFSTVFKLFFSVLLTFVQFMNFKFSP